ncbi:MAG: hypothetical protein MK329_17115 [Pirellulales bacterium]|nr:hypothetical protein [Pirellulales bacterium]|tara:strand:+ start:2371 stop:2649 length:279 start_codon:yes stop_codon:yes gene_type:complete
MSEEERPWIVEYDCATHTQTERYMNDEEFEGHKVRVAQAQEMAEAQQVTRIAEREKALSGRQKLADLGLDEAEINALVGAAPEEVQPVPDPA